jgi:hypothetical protein
MILAATNKCLAQNSKSRTGANATNRAIKPGNGAKTMARALQRCVSHHEQKAAPMKPFGNLILMTVICIVIFWVFMALRPAQAVERDLLVVVLKEADGKTSMHHQLSPNCMQFLATFSQKMREKERVILTFEAPPKVTGEVLMAYCIHPDGSKSSAGEQS